MVGELVKLKTECLGNRSGIFGVCYEEYCIGKSHGKSFIFENGSHDGFSKDEQEQFLEHIGFCDEVSDYKFSNVIKLSNDFNRGFFNIAFLEARNL